ncbi:hypothetical protein [Streptomyces sp. V1I6]|uniref:hypothetical protein n=1 Tax=Streptomyces sp. V1I6 TaxID=3042273 RepID=UPI0027834201|nr:hypothetical protein [Streptomyces sp. V1I6]MDQ0847575.1 hypothetical protein [Streptomyces sp. V1I6]
MPVSTPAAPVARERVRRTRTRRVSSRQPLAFSELLPQHLDMRRTDCMVLVCPDCVTWCPITNPQGRTPKLVPHHTEPAGTEDPRRCEGSNRIVRIDVTVAHWAECLLDGIAETKARRATRVLRKPKTPAPPATSHIAAPVLDASAALKMLEEHRQRCSGCDKNGQQQCIDGSRLVELHVRLERQEPRRRRIRAGLEELRQQAEQHLAEQFPARRSAEWARVLPAAKAADDQRAPLSFGEAPTEGPSVPLTTLHPTR